MHIATSTLDHINMIFELYREATVLQRGKFLENVWPEFSRNTISGVKLRK